MADKVKPYKISPREFDRFDRIKTLYLGKSGYKKISKEVLKANFDWLNKFYNANIDSIINIDTIIPMRQSYYNTRELVIKCARKSRVNVEDFLNKHFGIEKLTKKIEEVTEREALKGNKKTYLYIEERQKIEKLKIIEVLKPEILQVLKKLNIYTWFTKLALSKRRRHLIDLRTIILLNLTNNWDISLRDKVDSHSLSPPPSTSSNAMQVSVNAFTTVKIDDYAHLLNVNTACSYIR